MIYLLDTNTCIRFINGRVPNLRSKFLTLNDGEIVVSAITKAEMFYGSAKSQTPEISRAKQESFFYRFASLPFDDQAATAYGPMRAELERLGTLVGIHDMLIAAIALANDLIIVTHNVKEFQRIKGLKIEDWEV
jgi:tRNA(fMet)-specific endonuclease VapC